MRLPRVRFTVRGMMVAVAVVAVSCATAVPFLEIMRCRSRAFRREAVRYAQAEILSQDLMRTFSHASRPELFEICQREFAANLAQSKHEKLLKLKYERAARYPWIPVAPDPPEPE